MLAATAADPVAPVLHERRLGELVRPIGTLLVPVFFVLMGMRVVLGLALLVTLAATVGKQACAMGGLAPRAQVEPGSR